jgi:hypothetical protein
MKIRTMLLMSMTAVLLTTGYAAAENTQQEKMETCNAAAKQKALKGADRESFMKTCLSAGGEAAAAKPMNSQQTKMKTCNADATAKGLKGDARKTFMSSCLSTK